MYCLKLEMAYMCIYKHCTASMGAIVTDNSGYTHTGKGCLIGNYAGAWLSKIVIYQQQEALAT